MIRALRARWRLILWLLLLTGTAMFLWMLHIASSMPVERHTTVAVDWPAGVSKRPIRIALISDTHVSGPDNEPLRMRRIAHAVNAARPDIILLGGDYLSYDKPFGRRYYVQDAIAPLGKFRAPLGVVAVVGNHDFWRGTNRAARRALEEHGITVLVNDAVRRGPLGIGGVDDLYKGAPDAAGTFAKMRAVGGIPILLAHEGDLFADPVDTAALTLSGHTHCGQVSLPVIGPLWVPSRLGLRYACGRYDERGRTLIVGGGVGTTALPIRLGAVPEYWIITLVPRPTQ